MNQEEIKGILPHREPMLLVEEAEVTGENTAVGRYHVRGDEWFLQGHFPGNPVVPGVVLCEMMAQSCCVLLAGKLSPNAEANCDYHGHGEGHHDCKGHGEGHHGCGGHGEGHHGCGH